MLKFAIPGMYELANLNLKFIGLYKEHREFFYDNVEIEFVYGNPQFCIWDGGRIFAKYKQTTADELESLLIKYDELNMPFRYIFTSSTITKDQFDDRFGNILLSLGNKPGNEIVLVNDDFREYIHERYKNYTFVSSTTKCITTEKELREELARPEYRLVCLDHNHNHNLKMLKSFTPEEVSKSELLVNAICGPGCPHRKDHYYLNSISHSNYGKPFKMEGCYIRGGAFSSVTQGYSSVLSYKDLCEKYEPLGFEHFKLEGRTWTPNEALLTYCNYMIKPEHFNEVLGMFIWN